MPFTSSCARCGAPMAFGEGPVAYCPYCHAENRRTQGRPWVPSSGLRVQGGGSSAAVLATVVSVAVGALGLGVAVMLSVRSSGPPESPAPPAIVVATGGDPLAPGPGPLQVPLPATPKTYPQWSMLPPVPYFFAGDEVEDFLGVYRDDEQALWIGGFDGRTFAQRYGVGPFGKWGGRPGLHFALAGRRALYVDATNVLRVFEAEAGRELGSFPLTDKAEELCVGPEGLEAWVAVADEKHVSVDVAGPSVRPGPRPSWCPKFASHAGNMECDRDRLSASACHAGRGVKLEGFEGDAILTEGELHVVLGHKAPGTPLPMLAGGLTPGYRPPPPSPRVAARGNTWIGGIERDREETAALVKALKPSWKRNLGATDAAGAGGSMHWVALLRDRTLYVTYQAEGGTRLARVDAEGGATSWDVALPKLPADPVSLVVTKSRVYLPKWAHLLVFDAKTGASLGMIGNPFWLGK